MTIKALIPVRSGSLRVSNKNIRPFAGSSLLEIKINQLKRISALDGIVVNSNSDEMLEIAKNLGCEIVKRDDYFASNEVSINEVYVDMMKHFDADDVLFADVTNPLIKDETINTVIEKFYSDTSIDSVNTVNVIKTFLWKDYKAINYDPKHKPRSQDLPNIYAINSAINAISRENMLKNKDFIGDKPEFVVCDQYEGIDIDNLIDFEFAEFLFKKNNI